MFITLGVAAAAIVIFLFTIYRVADMDKALVITGGKEPIIKVSGGAFVIPIFRKASYFDLCMLTVPADSDEIKTKTSVPIIVDWTAQIRPNTKDMNILRKAIISFKERGNDGIIDDVKLTLMGAVRGVVATLTPEQVQNDKETFKNEIMKSVQDELDEMGLELVSLNIQDITDRNGYYDSIATVDMEEKRKEAEKVKALANQQIRQQTAESEKLARHSELDTELQIAEKAKDNSLKKAEFKTETDKANADAAVAGQLQQTIRMQEVAEQEGKVEVVRQEQANLAAQKRKEVVKTDAETERVKAEIKAEEKANVAKINAEAQAKVAEQEARIMTIEAEANAKVMEQEASGRAKAVEVDATGKAAAIKKEASANAEKIRLEGETEADIISKKGIAEAEAIKAKKLAEAEGEKALAEARAGNDRVNFEIEKLKIENEARIQIATNMGSIMAEIGKNAQFINLGGSGTGAGTNVLTDTLSSIPLLMKNLDVQNQALNGQSFNVSLQDLVSSLATPLKGIISGKEE